MNKKSLIIAIMACLVFAGTALAHCGSCGVGEAKTAIKTHTPHNASCLCGMAVTGDEEAHVEYSGKTYYFCSLACAEMFKDSPVETIEALTEEEESQL